MKIAISALETPPPVIASVGPPPDRHAERVATEMLAHLWASQATLWANAAGSLKSSQMGNPTGQQRAVARFRKASSDLLLDVRLRTGTRGRFDLTIATWLIWNPATSAPAMAGSALPQTPWLAIGFAHSARSRSWNSSVPMLVTHHACVRLAQRAGVKTVRDLMAALRDLWLALTGEFGMGLDRDCPAAGWRVPLPAGQQAVIWRDPEPSPRLIVKTILDAATHPINGAGT